MCATPHEETHHVPPIHIQTQRHDPAVGRFDCFHRFGALLMHKGKLYISHRVKKPVLDVDCPAGFGALAMNCARSPGRGLYGFTRETFSQNTRG